MLSATHRAHNWRKRRMKRRAGKYPVVLVGDRVYRVLHWSSLMQKRLKALKRGKRK